MRRRDGKIAGLGMHNAAQWNLFLATAGRLEWEGDRHTAVLCRTVHSLGQGRVWMAAGLGPAGMFRIR